MLRLEHGASRLSGLGVRNGEAEVVGDFLQLQRVDRPENDSEFVENSRFLAENRKLIRTQILSQMLPT